MQETKALPHVGYEESKGKILVQAALPVSEAKFLDFLSLQLAAALGYRVSRATMFRFAVHRLREWVQSVGEEEVLNAYVDAVQRSRKVPGEPERAEKDPSEAGGA